MRSRKTKSNNPHSELILCDHCQAMVATRRRPRFNERGHRLATIHEVEKRYERVPMLRLTGKWLAQAGFLIGQPIEIEVKRGKLIIRAAKTKQGDQGTTNT